LEKDMAIEEKAIKDYQVLIDQKVQDIWEAQERADTARREADKISVIARVFLSTLNRLRGTPVSDLMKDAESNADGAQAKEHVKEKEKRDKDKRDKKAAKASAKAAKASAKETKDGGDDDDDDDNASVSSDGSTNSIVDDIRRKEGHERTRDERKFVGVDIVLNPQNYAHLSVTEAEEMQFDPDYQCELTKLTIEKIKFLPEQISLAAPFLHGEKEFEVHRLLNKFLKGNDDAYYKHVDFRSGDSSGQQLDGHSDSDEEEGDEKHQVRALTEH
jgi:hypothetical protein